MAGAAEAEETLYYSSDNSQRNNHQQVWDGRDIRGVMFGAAVGGFCCRCLLHPLDTVKAMMQAQTSSRTNSSRNSGEPLLQQHLRGIETTGHGCCTSTASERAVVGTAAAGGEAAPRNGAVSLRYNTLLRSSAQALSAVWKKEGIRGLYRGFCICGFGSIPATCLYFTSYYLFAAAATDPAACLRMLTSPSPSSSSHSSTNSGSSAVAAPSSTSASLPSSKKQQQQQHGTQPHKPSPAVDLISGFGAEVISCVMWVPIDVCKERLQTQCVLGVYNYRGSFDCLRQICTSSRGIRELYKGYGATLLSFGPLSALFFMFDNQLKTQLQRVLAQWSSRTVEDDTREQKQLERELQHQKLQEKTTVQSQRPLPAWAAGGCAMVAAAAAAWLTAPLDKVKLRIQVQRATAGRPAAEREGKLRGVTVQTPYNYKSVAEGLKQMYTQEGVKGLFRASGARVAFHSGNFALLVALLESFKSVYLQYIEPLPQPERPPA